MATITQTLPAPQTTLVLHLCAQPTVQEHLHQLVDILLKNESRADELSCKISAVGAEICSLILNNSEEPSQLRKIAQKIHTLRNLILISPLDHAPLHRPLVEVATGRMWERWMLEHCRRLSGSSPFNSTPFAEMEVVPHEYAAEMIAWEEVLRTNLSEALEPLVHELRGLQLDLERSEEAEGWLNQQAAEATPDMSALIGYYDLAQKALEQEDRLQFNSILQACKEECEHVFQSTEAETAEHVARIQAGLQANSAVLRETLDTIERTHAGEVQDLRSQLAESRRQVAELEKRVGKTEARAATLAQEVHQLRILLQQVSAQNEANRQAAKGGGGGCVVM